MTKRVNYTLWTVQVVLALLFLFAGSMKLMLPIAGMTNDVPLPGRLLRFIGAAEISGALGLILPGMLRIRQDLTPLAASGLVVIMIGATIITASTMGIAPAIMPVAIGLSAGFIARGRSANFKSYWRQEQCLAPSQS